MGSDDSNNLRVSDLNVANTTPLPAPTSLFAEIQRTESQTRFVIQTRHAIQTILTGNDDRFLVVVGPCSIHDVAAGREYAKKLASLAKDVSDKMLLVMRVYFEKPRTTVGWKGLIMDPNLNDTNDIPSGLREARKFLCEVLDLGVPTATELLDPITPQYIAGLISWSAIGARTTESQTHRQMASGLSMPLGFKNSTNGSITPAVNAIEAATQPQTFLGVSQEGVASAVTTKGNPFCHIILRGGDDGPNYDAKSVQSVLDQLQKAKVCPSIMIDASHANSNKDHEQQPQAFHDIICQRVAGNKHIVAAMLESNLEAGNQKLSDNLTYGQSITDKCMDWATTEALIREAHANLS